MLLSIIFWLVWKLEISYYKVLVYILKDFGGIFGRLGAFLNGEIFEFP
jgi:prolipoprotein diacylglyceryltransferase